MCSDSSTIDGMVHALTADTIQYSLVLQQSSPPVIDTHSPGADSQIRCAGLAEAISDPHGPSSGQTLGIQLFNFGLLVTDQKSG